MSGACYNCGDTRFDGLYVAPSFDSVDKEYALGRCESCGLVNTLMVSEDELREAYSHSYYRSSGSKFTWLIECILSAFTRLQAIKLLDRWRSRSGAKTVASVLDIGCGRGNLLHEFDRLGARVQGVERQEFPGDGLDSNVYIGQLSDTFFEGKKFDVVILWHVLEHMEDTDLLLSSVVEHMSSNANLVISVPNFASLQQRIFGRFWFHLDLPRHLVHLEPDWLVARLESRGLEVEMIKHVDLVQNCYGFIQSALNCISPRDSNSLYRMLQYESARIGLKFFLYCSAAVLLSPFAVMESILSGITRRGATITIISRLRRNDD